MQYREFTYDDEKTQDDRNARVLYFYANEWWRDLAFITGHTSVLCKGRTQYVFGMLECK